MSQLDRRQVLKILGAVAAAGATGAAAGCTTQPQGTEMEQPSGLSFSVGLVAPALGPYSKIGADITNGFKLFLDDHDGLLARHRVDLKTAEEGATAESAVAAVRSLLDRGVMALVGVANPAGVAAVARIVNEARIPLVSPGTSPKGLATPNYLWRVAYVEGEAGRALAPYAIGEGRRAYVLSDDTAASRVEANDFAAAYVGLGGQVVGRGEGRTTFPSHMQNARSLGVNVVFAACTGADAQAALQAYRASGITAKLVGPGGLTETADLSKVGTLPERVYTAMYYAPDLDNEGNRRFVASFHKQYDSQPSTFAMAAYDCASVIDRALRLVKDNPTPAGLNQGLGLLGQIESPRGTWTFNHNRSPQQKWYLRKLRFDGQLPANLLDADLAVLS